MKSGSGSARDSEGDEDSDDVFESRSPTPPAPLKGGPPAGEFDDFDEEDFDDEFDDDFEEELEDEYELSEFGELTEEDLAEDEEVDVVPIGDFVDEDAEPEEPVLEPEEEPAAEEEGAGKKKKPAKKKGRAAKGEDEED
jgi:hypothetical protein